MSPSRVDQSSNKISSSPAPVEKDNFPEMISSPRTKKQRYDSTAVASNNHTNDDSTLLITSPNALSEAVLAKAMKECRKKNSNHHSSASRRSLSSSVLLGYDRNEKEEGDNDTNEISNHITNNDSSKNRDREIILDSEEESMNKKQKFGRKAFEDINSIWKFDGNHDGRDDERTMNSSEYCYNDTDSTGTGTGTSKNNMEENENNIASQINIEAALKETKKVVHSKLDSIMQSGLEAFYKNDELRRKLSQVKELCESREREIQRLKVSEVDTRASLSNLLQAVEASKSNARDSSRAAQTEARLRGEIATMRSERDVALGINDEKKRKMNLLDEEVRMLKSRVARLTQDKIKLERESRAALGMARSMDNHVASDVEFYRRKVTDLNDHLHSKNTIISELKHQIDSYEREIERSNNKTRLIQMRQSIGKQRN